MSSWNAENLIYIMAPVGYARKNIEKQGIKVYSPYHGDGLPLRIFREICFRIPILPKVIWYNQKPLRTSPKYIHIIDVNITVHYLKWIQSKFPEAQINFIYDNMVGKARNITPDSVPKGIRVWTYDDYDSKKYHIRLTKNYWVNEDRKKPKNKPEYDVFFVGKDKGRGEKLLELEKKLNGMGLKTKFIITKDGKLSKEKPYYQQPISYDEVIDFDAKSRAILNITMDNQEGVTMRDMESLLLGVKLITTNRNIRNKDLYNKNNVFILGEDNLDELPYFLNTESIDVWTGIKENHTFKAMIDELTQD